MNAQTASAIFDTQAEAQRAVAELRNAGVPDQALSVVTQRGRTTTTADVAGDVVDEEHGSIARGILGSGLVDQSQKMTVAARTMADKKTVGHLS